MKATQSIVNVMVLLTFGSLAAVPVSLGFRINPARQDTASRNTVKTPSDQETSGALRLLNREGSPIGFCPLKHTDVRADIAGYVARVTVTQQFINPSREPVEAIYTFPLPEDSAVDDMTMEIGNRRIRGTVMRREDARHVYEEARQRGQTAALLDQERPNIFTQHVAHIMPGADIRIQISYVNLLKYEEGWYEFTFPMVVGPRYTPVGGYREPGRRGDPAPVRHSADASEDRPVVTDPEKITPPITPPGTRAGHDISLTVRLDAGLPVQDIRSALHDVVVRRVDPQRAVVQLKNQQTIPNKDFVLRYTAAGSDLAEGLLTYKDPHGPGGYFTLILQPPMAPPQDMVAAKEMVFVIDQTGSQSGWPIKKAKETMAYCLRNLNPGDTFQLIGFNTEIFPCFPAPVPATRENIERALKWLEPIEGSGGTDILKSVDYALRIPRDPGRLRIVCYMTDGYVGNDMQIIQHIGRHRGEARMFPFGIGNSVNRFLIEGMAREGKGAAEYVLLNEDGRDHAARFYRRIASPLLLDVDVEWSNLPVAEVYPRHIPDVFTARPIILKGRYTHPGEGVIRITGLLRGKPWVRTLRVVFPEDDRDGSAIAALWAREKIEDLQSQDWMGAQTGNPRADIKEAIVRVALEHRLMTQYTSFVAVEQQVVNVGGKQRTIDVPIEMPEGVSYEGIFGPQVAADRQDLGFRWAAKSSGTRSRMPAAAGLGGGSFGPPGIHKHADASESVRLQDKSEGRATSAVSLLRQQKLSETLRKRLEKPTTERILVQVWLNDLPDDGIKHLNKAGFVINHILRPGKVLLGTIPLKNLDALIALDFVRAVEEARFK